jgi:hypothetical protein
MSSLPQGGRVNNIAIAQNQAYLSVRSGSVSNVSLSDGTQGWTAALGGQVVGVAVNSANSLVTAASTNGWFYMVSTSTHLPLDSVALAATPVQMVATSTGTRAFVDENNFQLEIIDIAAKAVIAQTSLPGTVTAMKMAPGDTVLYAATTFGNVLEVNTQTGAIKRSFQPSSTVRDFSISPDGKTMAVADGTPIVQLVRLATGGLSGSVDYGANVNAVAFSPDRAQLWVGMGAVLYASPFNGVDFDTGLIAGRITVAGANFTKIAFNANGSRVTAFDDGGLNLVVLR